MILLFEGGAANLAATVLRKPGVATENNRVPDERRIVNDVFA